MNKPLNEIDREIDAERKQMLQDNFTTVFKKQQFIKEIKSGLGEEIKKNPSKVIVHKKSKYKLFIDWLKNLFTKF